MTPAPRRLDTPLVAVLEKRGRFLVGEPLFDHGPRTAVDRHGAGEGDLVLVGSGKRGARGAADRRRRARRDRGADARARAAPRVRRAATAEAEGAADEPYAAADRVDLRELPTFTIDPAEAQDFDDAISAVVENGFTRVWVHIADVTAYVRPGGPLEREAFRRATSVYVPGAVEPMLPEVLSSRECSLRPGEDRLAVTVEMEIEGAEVRRVSFHRSRVRSDARLTYGQVEDCSPAASAPPTRGRGWRPRARSRRPWPGAAALEVGGAEPSFSFDSDGHVTGVAYEEQTESHRLIEQLMVLANEQVAAYLEDAAAHALPRSRAPRAAIGAFMIEQLASLDVRTPPVPENMSAQQAADLATETSRLVPDRHAFRSLILRSLKQAFYSPRNLGHAGLGSARYCHFTSPIRRYPDVVAHALLQGLGIDHAAAPAHELDEAGIHSSAVEREKMERDADDVCLAFLLERNRPEGPLEGEVVGLIEKGVFVRFGEEGYEGFLPVRRLRGWWTLNELGTALVAEESGRRLRLGDPIDVTVERIDAPRGRVDLSSYPHG